MLSLSLSAKEEVLRLVLLGLFVSIVCVFASHVTPSVINCIGYQALADRVLIVLWATIRFVFTGKMPCVPAQDRAACQRLSDTQLGLRSAFRPNSGRIDYEQSSANASFHTPVLRGGTNCQNTHPCWKLTPKTTGYSRAALLSSAFNIICLYMCGRLS